MAVSSLKLTAIILGLAVLITAKPLEDGGKNWALLVAGSNGYFNYRHQADVCHAYHVLKNHGFPEENIIVMMYDDIANNEENPRPGVIINRPGGENVYEGVKIDYRGENVTPEVFLAVLQGKKSSVNGVGTGKVIESGPNDKLFVNFVDHGGVGLIAFPNGLLKARDFVEALKHMHKAQKYSQMVIYIEACESGSMLNDLLPDNINIYATTASNPSESSYACYYDKELGTYLGDVYSVSWMENSDKANLNTETLHRQYEITKQRTNTSHVQEYGHSSIGKEPVGDFQGNNDPVTKTDYPEMALDSVPSPDVDLHILQKKMSDATTAEDRDKLNTQLNQIYKRRSEIGNEMKHIISSAVNHAHSLVSHVMSVRTEAINFDCYEPVVENYINLCRNINQEPYAMRMLYALQNACNAEGIKSETLISAMRKVCHNKPRRF